MEGKVCYFTHANSTARFHLLTYLHIQFIMFIVFTAGQFPAPKFLAEKEDQCNVVYKIPCGACSWRYIGETGRSLNNTRKKEHTRNVKMHTKGSNVANHASSKNHQIDFDNALIINKADFATSRPLSLGTLQKLLTLTITHARSPISTASFQANTSFHTFSILTLHCFAFISLLFKYSFYIVAYFYPLKTTGWLLKAHRFFKNF